MDIKFDKGADSGEETQVPTPEKGGQTKLLLVLVLLLGVFGYIYFFTGLIRPQEAPPAPPQPAQQIVKQPLPSRDAVPADTTLKDAAKAPVPTPAAAKTPEPAPGAAAVKPVQKPSDVKPAATHTAKPAEPAKTAQAKPVAPVPVKPVVKPAEPAKPAPTALAPKKAEQPKPVVQSAGAKPEQKAAAQTKTELKKDTAVKAVEPVKQAQNTKGPWTLVVGVYVVEESLATDLVKVKKAGFTPLVTSGPKRPVAMNRLFYGETSSKDEAQKAIEKLKAAGGDGFSVQRGSKHDVFAGSYSLLEGAKAEQQRLGAAGVKVELRKVKVGVASRRLTAGSFAERKAADEALKKLKTVGVGSPILE